MSELHSYPSLNHLLIGTILVFIIIVVANSNYNRDVNVQTLRNIRRRTQGNAKYTKNIRKNHFSKLNRDGYVQLLDLKHAVKRDIAANGKIGERTDEEEKAKRYKDWGRDIDAFYAHQEHEKHVQRELDYMNGANDPE